MGAMKDKVRGAANVGIGRIRQGAARDLGDSRLASEGAGQELRGHSQRFVGRAKDFVAGLFHRTGSRIRRSG